MRRTMVLVQAVLALLLVSAGSAGSSTSERPFHANLQGHTTSVVFAPPGTTSTFGGRCSVPSNWVISFEGTGEATHLGSFTWASSHCTQVGANPPATVTLSDGRLEYVVANGDVLREHYFNGRLIPVSPMLVCLDNDATFVGGSGRFEHASGSAVERTCFDPNDPNLPALTDLRIVSTGTIVYDASDRAG